MEQQAQNSTHFKLFRTEMVQEERTWLTCFEESMSMEKLSKKNLSAQDSQDRWMRRRYDYSHLFHD
jgi:hypothetical protein